MTFLNFEWCICITRPGLIPALNDLVMSSSFLEPIDSNMQGVAVLQKRSIFEFKYKIIVETAGVSEPGILTLFGKTSLLGPPLFDGIVI